MCWTHFCQLLPSYNRASTDLKFWLSTGTDWNMSEFDSWTYKQSFGHEVGEVIRIARFEPHRPGKKPFTCHCIGWWGGGGLPGRGGGGGGGGRLLRLWWGIPHVFNLLKLDGDLVVLGRQFWLRLHLIHTHTHAHEEKFIKKRLHQDFLPKKTPKTF